MHLNPKALAIALGLGWAAGVFCVGVAHLFWPGYGGAFLDLVASIYPGYHVGGVGTVIVATLYAATDGAICGALVAWLYNATSGAAAPRA
jgi:hypothetical protein